MRYVYTINGIGINNIVFFANKQLALAYAKVHNIRKLPNGHWGVVRVPYKMATKIRDKIQ